MPQGNRPNPPAHVARVALGGTVFGVNWNNVFWVRNGKQQTPSQSDFQDFATTLWQYYHDKFLPLAHQEVLLTTSSALYYGPAGADLGAEFGSSAPGSKDSQRAPNSLSCGISWTIQQHYKGGHPRTYLPPTTTEELQDGHTWKSAFISDVADAANDFQTAVEGYSLGNLGTLHLGTVSFVLRKEWRDPPVFRDYVPGAARVDSRPDTQRRRLGRDV